MTKTIVALTSALLLSIVLFPSTANAGYVDGYIVNVQVEPHPQFGSDGGIRVQVGSTYVYFCSKNNTSTVCTLNSWFWYSQTQLMALAQMLRHSMAEGLHVHIWTDTSRPNGGNTIEYSNY